MGINLNDLDGLLGYDPATHSIAGMPTMGDHTHPLVAARAGMPPPAAPDIQTPGYSPEMASPSIPQLQPPNKQQSQSAGKNEFKLGMPHVTDQPETPGYYQQKESVNQYEQAHPWGSDVSAHPGMLGKIGHALGRIGNAAGDFAAPGLMLGIPGSDLNRRMQSQENEQGFNKAQELETQKEGVEQRPEIAEATGELRGQQQAERDATAKDIAAGKNATTEKVAGEKNATTEDVAKTNAASREKMGADLIKARTGIAQLADATRRQIAQEHEAGANSRAANNPNKLTATNEGRAQFAKTVLEQVPNIQSEIDGLAQEIGPAAGRWNDFWVNKGGLNDPKFAALNQDLGLYASAIAVMHFGARGGGQHFIEGLKKDFGEAQSPEDLKARIASAAKWATGYANMDQQGGAATGGATSAPAPGGKVLVEGKDF